MAWELPLFRIGNLKAHATLAAKQFYCVKAYTTNNEVVVCDSAGEPILGVVQNKPAAGEAADVMGLGVTKVVAAETLTAGDLWGTGAAGTAVKVEATATGADVRSYAAGMVLEGAAVGELATVTVGFPSGQVSA